MTSPPTALPAPARPERTAVASEPERPYRLYAMCDGSGPVIVGTYATEPEQRAAYRVAMQRLAEGSYYAEEVRDFALGEDPEWRKSQPVVAVDFAGLFGGAGDTQIPASRSTVRRVGRRSIAGELTK